MFILVIKSSSFKAGVQCHACLKESLTQDLKCLLFDIHQYGVELISQSSFCLQPNATWHHREFSSCFQRLRAPLLLFYCRLIPPVWFTCNKLPSLNLLPLRWAASSARPWFSKRTGSECIMMATDLACVTSRHRGQTVRWCLCIVRFWC